jgi:hypoxanthine phosphoribosyltransferase
LEFEVPTWDQVYDLLLNIAERIRNSRFKSDVIVGVSRGGLPPSRVLSDLLGNPNSVNVRTEFYSGVAETKIEPNLTEPLCVSVADQRVLVVDEIVDTGESLKLVRGHILHEGAAEIKTATVYCKPWSVVKPDYFGKETGRWVVFPWEIRETIQKIVRKSKEEGRPVQKETTKLVKAGMSSELINRFLEEIRREEHC